MELYNKTLLDYNEEESRRRIVPVIYLSILMTFGVVGNLLVLVIYPRNSQTNTHQIYIIGLAIPDLLVCLVILPFEVVEMRYQYMFYNEIICKVFRTMSHWFSLASMVVLITLSFDTYKRICKPLKRQISRKTAKLSIGLTYMFTLPLCSPGYFGSGIRLVELDNHTTGCDCSLADEYADTLLPIIGEGVVMLIAIAGIIILIVFYSLIGRKILAQERFRRQFKQNEKPKTSSTVNESDQKMAHVQNIATVATISNRKERSKEIVKDGSSTLLRVTKIAFMISVVFIISYIPHIIVSLLTAIKGSFLLEPGPVSSAVMPILARSVMINNVANPVIYGYFDKRFREGCNSILNAILCRR